ncbi:MAG: hypothetical protein DI568_05910 [Sphingomonas sp.]|nr:MAG: hypothetical protein DI568_05910 [Sphingomonas sp.]
MPDCCLLPSSLGVGMKRLKSTTAILAVATALACSGTASANTLYFQMNPNYQGLGQRQVFIFGQANSTGTVTGGNGFSQDFDLGSEGFAIITLPNADELTANVVQSLGFRVSSEAAVSGYFLSRQSATTDMTYLIDGERLGTNYVVAGYQNIYPDQMSVQATQDGTVVTFTPKNSTAFQVTLNAGETYMYQASTNLSGSSIVADKPIAVFSGNQCTNIPTGVSACDHIVEQMPSVDQLSSSYLLAQTPRTGTLGNVMRVIATEDNTEVRVNGAVVATLAAKGDYYEGRVAGGVELVASAPVLVAQYLIGQGQAGVNTDPAMTIVPGSDQWLKSYVFATPSGTANFPTDFVSIVIQTSSLGSLTIDGAVADGTLFNPLGSTLYSYGNIDVSAYSGPFSISADTPFQLLLSGFDSYDSYFTYGGAAFAPGASPPPDPVDPPPPGIDVYWDGDGAGSADNGNVDGGSGILTADSVNLTLENGATNNVLPESATVIFEGTPGTVTIDDVDGPLSFAGLRFGVDGYVLTGDNFALAAEGTPVINVAGEVGEGGTTAYVATIQNVITGTQGFAKTGIGTLVLSGLNTYSGGTNVQQGTVIGNSTTFGTGSVNVSSGATVIFNQTTAGSFSQGLGGAGNFVKAGAAALILGGANSFSGSALVQQGLLQVSGFVGGGSFSVASGGILGGTGTVGSTVVQSGGRVAPGASIGTLTVSGNFTQSTGSFYDVELNSLGVSDLLDISGTATIEPGATLTVTKLDTAQTLLGTSYLVLTADGGRTGTYSNITGNTRVSAFINLVPVYTATDVWLTASKTRAFAAAGLTPNQIAAAGGADHAGNGALYNAILYLQTDAEAQAAFDSISGEIHASLRGITLEDSRFVREAMINRTVGEREPSKALWIHGYGSWASISNDGNAAQLKRDIGGFFLGGEMVSDSGLIVGAVTGYGKGDVQVDGRLSSADTSDAYLGGYVGYNAFGFNARAGLAYQWRDVKTTRQVGFTGFSDRTTAKYDLNTFQIFADAGYKLNIGLEPFFQLAYVDVSNGGFSESGGTAALDGSGGANFWLTQLGTRFGFGLGTGIALNGSIGWRHLAGGDRNTPVTMAFGAGPSFDILGASLAKDSAALSLAVGGSIGKNLSIDLGYSGVAGKGFSDHGVRGSLTFRF